MRNRSGMRLLLAAVALPGMTGAANAALVISDAPTSNVNCAAGVCTATATDAVLNASDLTGMLASSDVTLKSGSSAQDIEVSASFSWTNANRLTLDAFHSIAFNATVVVAGAGGLAIATNDGGAGGDFAFASGVSADFWDISSSLIIDGVSFHLAADLPALSSAIATDSFGRYGLAKNYDASIDGIHKASPIPGTFSGRLEGLGHSISNMSVHAPKKKHAALFENLSRPAVLRDLVLANVFIKGGSIGGFAGSSAGAIIQCTVSGKLNGVGEVGGIASRSIGGLFLRTHADVHIESANDAGGIVSEIEFDGSSGANPVQGIYQSDARGSVSGWDAGGIVGHLLLVPVDHSRADVKVKSTNYAGGIAGTDFGFVQYSSASGNVSVGDAGYAGGLVGYAQGNVTTSFSTGDVHGGDNAHVGGLLGGGLGSIIDAYATGSAQGHTGSKVGGLAGSSDITSLKVDQSYSLGAPTALSGSSVGGLVGEASLLSPTADYFDTTTSHMRSDEGAPHCPLKNCDRRVKGLNDSKMRAALPSAFDPAVWGQSPGINNGYPYLLANPPQ